MSDEWDDEDVELSGPGPCARCGRNPAEGFASSWDNERGERWLCHPDDEALPDCYSLDSRAESLNAFDLLLASDPSDD